jgi:hypothetical protein
MRNAKQELLDTMGLNIADLRCATITYNPFYDETPPKKMVLKEGYTQADLDEFISKLDFEYDGGYGSQELFGMVWFNNGYWMDRYEYDGAERWDWHKYPSIPNELKESSFPEPDPKDIDYPEDEEYAHGDDECYDYDEHTSVITDERDYEQELHPEYIIASTNLMMQETMVFCADADGHITSFGGLNSIALRYGQEYWEDAFAAVIPLNTDEHKYIYVRTLESDKNIHNLFRRISTSDAVVI